MSDDLDIRSGGVVAVDTASLRQVAEGFAAVAGGLGDVDIDLNDIFTRLLLSDPLVADTAWHAVGLMRRAEQATDAAAALTAKLGDAATVYEIVELRAQRALALAAGDETAVTALEARIAALAADDPHLLLDAISLEALWWLAGPTELASRAGQSPFGAFAASAASLSALAIGMYGRGRVGPDARLNGPVPPVAVTQLGPPHPATPPSSLAAVVGRMPQGEARVRVERYVMPDGSKRFAVYVTGTRGTLDTADPWDFRSNPELYSGENAASYEATLHALRDSGAQPGDAVYAVGHSQGGMIASHLALAGEFEVRALVTLGSPVSAAVGPDTLSVQLRHTDDPVVALADGGHPGRVGSENSFIAERVADPASGMQGGFLAAHRLEEYRETAGMVDDSTDPRAAALDEMFGELAEAESVEALEYTAVRTGVVVTPVYPDSNRTLPGG